MKKIQKRLGGKKNVTYLQNMKEKRMQININIEDAKILLQGVLTQGGTIDSREHKLAVRLTTLINKQYQNGKHN